MLNLQGKFLAAETDAFQEEWPFCLKKRNECSSPGAGAGGDDDGTSLYSSLYSSNPKLYMFQLTVIFDCMEAAKYILNYKLITSYLDQQSVFLFLLIQPHL